MDYYEKSPPLLLFCNYFLRFRYFIYSIFVFFSKKIGFTIKNINFAVDKTIKYHL